jgi:hypothetical protein
MNNRFRMLKGWHKTLLRLAWPVLRRIAALGLALSLIGIKPSTSVLAAPRSIGYDEYFLVTAIPSTEYVCTGDFMYFTVSISKQLVSRAGDTGRRFGEIRDVTVSSTIGDTSLVSTIDNELKIGSTAADSPTSVRFWFKAGDNPGQTFVIFESYISHYFGGIMQYGQDEIRVESPMQPVVVRNCSYKIDMLFLEPMAGFGSITGTAKIVQLRQVAPKKFEGPTILSMNYNFEPGLGCPINGIIRDVVLKYTADLTDDKLYINFNFPGLDTKVTLTSCGDLPQTTTNKYLTQPGSGTVLVSSKGGATVLQTPYWTYLFIVTRVPVE